MKSFWESLSRPARVSLVLLASAVVVSTGALGWWLTKPQYQVLFSDLRPADATVMLAELEKLKIPHQFDENTATIRVDQHQVHSTRMKLMGKEMPLQGAVGFELFNNSDFGMTEFAQKINYQRALQGELTRTILSFPEIRDVRVHLALPEQTLFKQSQVKPKAAITLTMRDGQQLQVEQIAGIQRLVSAATPGLTPQDVTVVDHRGVALSRTHDDAAETSGTPVSGRLDQKKELEIQLARKATQVLEKAFGANQVMASVDVTLNHDQVKVTTEDILGSNVRQGEARGVVVKEREIIKEPANPGGDSQSGRGTAPAQQREVEYQVGRRVEQVVSPAGSIRRLHVVAVVKQALDPQQEERVRKMLAASVGVSPERGDSVVVQSLQALVPNQPVHAIKPESSSQTQLPLLSAAETQDTTGSAAAVVATGIPAKPGVPSQLVGMLIGVVLLMIGGGWLLKKSFSRPELSDVQRQEVLSQLRSWLEQPETRSIQNPKLRESP